MKCVCLDPPRACRGVRRAGRRRPRCAPSQKRAADLRAVAPPDERVLRDAPSAPAAPRQWSRRSIHEHPAVNFSARRSYRCRLRRFLRPDLAQDPCFREPQVTVDGRFRHLERFRELLIGQASEVMQLDNLREAGTLGRRLLQASSISRTSM